MKIDTFRGLVGFLLSLTIGTAQAAVQTKAVTYDDHGTKLTGHLYWDDAKTGKRPGVVVYHEWWGLNEYAKKRARMLAELGYVAFAADMYGDGKITESPDQARQWMQQVTVEVDLWRERANLGLAQLKASDLADTGKLAISENQFPQGDEVPISDGNGHGHGLIAAPDGVLY